MVSEASFESEQLAGATARARAIVAAAEAEGERIVEAASTRADFEARRIREEGLERNGPAMLRMPSTTTPLHSSEITLREFPRAVHGFDREAVSRWLAFVEQSYRLLEDELDRRRNVLNGLMTGLGEMRRHLARAAAPAAVGRLETGMRQAEASWDEVLKLAASSVASTRLGFDTLLVRAALMETPLRRSFTGFARDPVRRLLETSAAQLARLENQLHLAHAENDRLLSLFLEQIADVGTSDR